ncbi:hypothetical protein [Dactylosporangium salmoneum]|uniref:Major facilitator superfamily (MFS) profile domain-containing protein n=1 Tax=Dactylosporangium salmoneum TaxID=53361 RepID=A0ABN3I7B1_9ACTN
MVARWVLLAAGAAALAGGLAGLLARAGIVAAYALAYDGGAGPARGHAAVLVGAGLGAAAAGCCAYAAAGVRQGRRAAAWLVCALLAGGLSPVVFGGGTIVAPRIVGAGASSAEIGADLRALAPRWYVPAVSALACFGAVAALVAALLLFLPPRLLGEAVGDVGLDDPPAAGEADPRL